MPNRMIRDWTNSDRIEKISAGAEVFFTRLIMKADDYGCFWADERRLKSNLFPLRSDSIREADITRWMAECHEAGLFVFYESDNKKYLQIIDFNQRLRTKKRRFPSPDGLTEEESEEGFVYAIGASEQTSVLKIGHSLNPWARAKEVSTGNHEPLKVIYTFKGSKKEEHELHKLFFESKKTREWFDLSDGIRAIMSSCSGNSNAKDLIIELRSYYDNIRSPEEKGSRIGKEVENHNNDGFFQMFRRVAGKHISDQELLQEISKFKNKYPNAHANRSGALINSWVARIGSNSDLQAGKKEMVL